MSTSTIAVRRPGLRLNQLLPKLTSHLILALFTVVIVYPFVWMVLASFKTQSDLLSNVWGLPRSLAWQNFTSAWQTAELGYALFNSVVVSVVTTLLVISLAATAGYALATFRFRFATAIFLIFVLTMQAPVPFIPLYILLVWLHLTDSLLGLILTLAAGGLPISIFIFWGYFQTVPRELREAAVIDGCSEWKAFLRVVLPIAGPAIASVGILEFIAAWNEYFLPLILIRTPELRTLPLAIQVFFFTFGNTQWEQVFAALTIGTVPTLLLYAFLQRWFIQGLTAGVVKG